MLSKTAEYALRAVVWLARDERTESADRLAEVTQVPRRYLNRVLRSLVRRGLVRSQPGPGGGYGLARGADAITVLEVVDAVAPVERIRRCPLGIPSHGRLCPLHAELDQVYAAFEAGLARVTVGRLASSADRPLPLCDVAALAR